MRILRGGVVNGGKDLRGGRLPSACSMKRGSLPILCLVLRKRLNTALAPCLTNDNLPRSLQCITHFCLHERRFGQFDGSLVRPLVLASLEVITTSYVNASSPTRDCLRRVDEKWNPVWCVFAFPTNCNTYVCFWMVFSVVPLNFGILSSPPLASPNASSTLVGEYTFIEMDAGNCPLGCEMRKLSAVSILFVISFTYTIVSLLFLNCFLS